MSKNALSRDLNNQRRERVAELTRQGFSSADISAFLSITKRSVARIRSDLGVARPASGSPLTEDEIRRATALLDDGCSYAEVARTLGRSIGTVSRRFPGRGWTVREGAQLANAIRRAKEIERASA